MLLILCMMVGSSLPDYDGVGVDFNELSGGKTTKPVKSVPVDPILKLNERVSVWDRLNSSIKHDDEPQKNYANVVGNSPKSEMQFFPLEEDAKRRVHIPMALTKGMANTFRTVLYGYFLGPRIPFPIVLRSVQNAWGKFGFRDATVNGHGFFFFRFNDEGGCSQVVESSPLMIKGIPLFVAPWDPSKGIHKPEHTTCPLWIKFYNIPLVAFNREGISRIASAVGVPLKMDACTTNTCDNTWGRTSFAKVLVNVWASGDLTREVEVVIPHLSGKGEDVVKVELEYDWEPTQCSICKIFGHKVSSCPKAEIVQKKEIPNISQKDKENVDDGGWITVGRKQWKPKGVVKESMNVSKAMELGQKPKSGVDMKTHEDIRNGNGGKSNEGSLRPDMVEEDSTGVEELQEKATNDLQVEEARWVYHQSIKEGEKSQGQMNNCKVNSVSKPIKGILKHPKPPNINGK